MQGLSLIPPSLCLLIGKTVTLDGSITDASEEWLLEITSSLEIFLNSQKRVLVKSLVVLVNYPVIVDWKVTGTFAVSTTPRLHFTFLGLYIISQKPPLFCWPQSELYCTTSAYRKGAAHN